MAKWRQAIELAMSDEDIAKLTMIARSRTERGSRVERARMLLAYRADPSFFSVGRAVGVHHQTVQRCVERALAYGPLMALDDRPRPGKAPTITPEAKAWLVDLACRKAKDTWAIRMSCGRGGCWRAMRASTGPRRDTNVMLTWSRGLCARFLAMRTLNRTRCAITWSAVMLSSIGRWPKFCASIARFKCSNELQPKRRSRTSL